MSTSKEEILINYLDNRLEGRERLEAEQLIGEDAAAAQELDHLRFSVELVREAAVLDQVSAARTAFQSAAKLVPIQKKEGGAIVRSFSKNVWRVAATVLLVLGAATVYKYSNTTATAVYDQNFTSFDLSTSRGTNNDGELETAYRNRNWTGVERVFAGEREKNSKSWFLDGMAEMELKNYDKAIIAFNGVINQNRNSTDPYFQDEAEYYLAMGYLAAKQPADGVTILKKIRSDKNHLFNKKALAIPALDLAILEHKR